MRLLHEDEISCVEYLLEKEGQVMNIKYSDIEYSSDYFGQSIIGVDRAFDFLLELNKSGLISIKSSKIEWNSFFYDSLLRQYSDLINKKDFQNAEKLSITIGLEALSKTLVEQKSLEETYDIIEEIFSKNKNFDIRDSDFSRDLYDAISLSIEVKEELREYLKKYLTAFRNDELIKPLDPKPNDEWSSFPSYFKRDFYRYKKQKQIFVDLIKQKLDTQNPKKVVIFRQELPTEHLNDSELILSLEEEGFVNNAKLNDDFSAPNSWILDVNEEKILKEPSSKEIKLNLSFSLQTGIMALKDQKGTEYKLKLQGQVQREVMRVIFEFPKNTYSDWSLSEISSSLGRDDVDETAVKNAIYQFNKKVKLKIPEVDNLFELTKYSTRVNPKYVNKN